MGVVGLDDRNIFVLPVIKGLVDEVESVRKAYEETRPGAIALSISAGELKSLQNMSEVEAPPSNFEEEIYMRELERYGKVRKPPPCFVEAVKLARENPLSLYAIDMDEDLFTTAFCYYVSTLDLVRHSRTKKKLKKKRFVATNPYDFVMEFDREVNKLKGYRMLERARERYMARQLIKLKSAGSRILALIELERAEGVMADLTRR